MTVHSGMENAFVAEAGCVRRLNTSVRYYCEREN